MATEQSLIEQARRIDGPIVVLTGAGVSAESGIPTFRGEEGYWRIGSRNYHPMELATATAFRELPDEVWAWYLYRRGVCRGAEPNRAHRAIADAASALGEGLLLLTQNVDGLHLRAGSPRARTYEIHGNIDFMRCASDCTAAIMRVPDAVDVEWPRGRGLEDAERELLRCPSCGGRSRPHVLWFDEYYDEAHFRFESSLAAAGRASLLLVIGTTGQTNLPLHVGRLVAARGAPLFVVNPEPSPFTEMAAQNPNGLFLQGTAGEHVPRLMALLS